MKKQTTILTLFLFIFSFHINGQTRIWRQSVDSCSNHGQFKRRNIIWYNPSRANEINGIAISAFITPYLFKSDSLEINGINIGIEPEWIMAIIPLTIGSLASPFNLSPDNEGLKKGFIYPDSEKIDVKINGLSIGLIGSTIIENRINGLTLSAVGNIGQELNGLSFAFIINGYFRFNGIQVAGLQNKTTIGRGIQIGLFNYCKDFKGVQIGLLNKIGKRMLPFINFRF